jgi:hypothetical protein
MPSLKMLPPVTCKACLPEGGNYCSVRLWLFTRLHGVKPLRVPDALNVVAGRCTALAGEVAAGAPPVSGLSSQSSAVSVSAADAGVETAGAAMATRMQATGAKISAASTSYDDTEAQSTASLRAVPGRLV